MSININRLTKSYGDQKIFEDVNLSVQKGEIAEIKGETGKGKTTLKRCIAGLEDYEEGSIDVQGDIAYVFQDERVMPWLNVRKNILLPLKLRNEKTTEEKLQMMHDIASSLRVEQHLDKDIREVSGGQLQRLLLVRALVTEPEVLLLDEPFNSLDTETRQQIYREVLEICEEKDITVLVASHNEDLDNFVNRSVALEDISN